MYSSAKQDLEREREYLREAIVLAVKAGITHRRIAELTGLSRQRITQLNDEGR